MSDLINATNGFLGVVTSVLTNRRRADDLYLAWGGWEKWLQGEIILGVKGQPFLLSQEDNVYLGKKYTADFVIKIRNGTTRGRNGRSAPDICIVELKAVSINQNIATFKKGVSLDINKLFLNLNASSNSRGADVARLMIAVSTPGKALDCNFMEDKFRASLRVLCPGKDIIRNFEFQSETKKISNTFTLHWCRWLAPASNILR